MTTSTRTIQKLSEISKGDRVVYHRGTSLNDKFGPNCDFGVVSAIQNLLRNEKVHLVQRRITLPTFKGSVDRKHGTGTFEYIAIGI